MLAIGCVQPPKRSELEGPETRIPFEHFDRRRNVHGARGARNHSLLSPKHISNYAYSVPTCWFRSTAVIIRVAVALKAARKSKLASTPAGPSIGVLASAR